MTRLVLCGLLLQILPLAAAPAQEAGFDPEAVALAWHRLTGTPLDAQRLAERSEAARRASNFDRPEVIRTELARYEGLVAAADPARVFATQVNDNISEYDHERGRFTITLFSPGYYLPVQAFGQEYQVVFANAESARHIVMGRDEARSFDQGLNRHYRRVITEVQFRVVGDGDPAGGVTGQRVVRAELLAARVLDPSGNPLHTPTIAPVAAAPVAPLDPAGTDVAGFRIGTRARDLEQTLVRLIGPVERSAPGSQAHPGIAAKLTANEMGCQSWPGQRRRPEPGAFCVIALLDDRDLVRVIRVERLFPGFDSEAFRSALTARYGPVAQAQGGGERYMLGWGEPVDPALAWLSGGPHRTLNAYFEVDRDFLSISGNAIPRIRVILELVDAAWASRTTK